MHLIHGTQGHLYIIPIPSEEVLELLVIPFFKGVEGVAAVELPLSKNIMCEIIQYLYLFSCIQAHNFIHQFLGVLSSQNLTPLQRNILFTQI